MKKVILVFALFIVGTTFAQEVDDITSKNSWLKIGLNTGLPIGDSDEFASATLGLDLKGQFLVTPNFGIGVATGYTHFFAKDGADDFGIVPIAGFARYYFQPKGLFVGADFGYGFLTNVDNEGGLYVNPQIGYHNEDWNLFAYYQNTFAENDVDIQVLGIGATYNLRF
ncbi:hypothetical protein LX77_00724 [Gelidibacter algens]|uniref:Outer membrane protein with beta-barrel domain n=1 Tax=Gelidibacter algens TaxID=49280 RepID=A0A1A7R624_9FLAO|nr:hypothetical protein [Gelidibacter algens]OBX26924.1 hypothetical protein A9996_02340 [Gelidibacter algens]RAJ26475.1 hypothetical protein LX77_00724 [Gelidibacter algens]